MAERRGGGEAGLAGVDVPAVLGGEPAQVQVLDLDAGRVRRTSRAISVSRKDLDISPGQVCSLRDEPLISRRRAGPAGSSWRIRAASIAARAATQSSAKS